MILPGPLGETSLELIELCRVNKGRLVQVSYSMDIRYGEEMTWIYFVLFPLLLFLCSFTDEDTSRPSFEDSWLHKGKSSLPSLKDRSLISGAPLD